MEITNTVRQRVWRQPPRGFLTEAFIDTDGTAVICNPVPFGAVTEIARHGERVPRKSTSFGPKPRSGLVLRSFDALSPVRA